MKHKDVDIAVIGGAFGGNQDNFSAFEGGIDWWHPQEQRFFNVRNNLGNRSDITVTWWQNAMLAKLTFKFSNFDSKALRAGLYIQSPNWVVNMRISEINTISDMDYDVEKAFEKAMKRRIGNTLPKYIKDKFQNSLNSLINIDKFEKEVYMKFS